VSSSVSRFESANLILDVVIVPASMCPTAGGTQSGPFKVRYGTPADPTSEAIKSLVKALKSPLSSQRALIKNSLVRAFEDRVLSSEFGRLPNLLLQLRNSSHADSIGPDGSVLKWSGALFGAVITFFLRRESEFSMRPYFYGNDIPTALVRLAFAAVSTPSLSMTSALILSHRLII
jgi:hypothetical protein